MTDARTFRGFRCPAEVIADEKPTWAIACDLRVGERTVVRVQRRMAREAAGGDAGAIPTP